MEGAREYDSSRAKRHDGSPGLSRILRMVMRKPGKKTEGEKEDVERDAAKPRGPCKVRKGERENKFSGSLQVILLPARRSRNIG